MKSQAVSTRRDSEWMVMRRCLVLIERLLRGPSSKTDLIEAVRASQGEDSYGDFPRTTRVSAFEKDIGVRLPGLGCRVRFNRRTSLYEIVEIDTLLGFDVPDQALAALAFLEDTFQPGTPHHERVRSLLQHLRMCLAEERRRALDRERVALRVSLRQLNSRPVAASVSRAIERAQVQRRLLRFRYLSPAYEDSQPRTHTVEPYDYYFDSAWGHHYLYAYCRSIDGPNGAEQVNRYIRYRPERILSESIEVLETKLPPGQPKARRHTLTYRLAPALARAGDVSQHFPAMVITPQEDGSVIVRAEVDDLFFALRTLLHYGAMCEVLGGPEALRDMREIVQGMAKVYEES